MKWVALSSSGVIAAFALAVLEPMPRPAPAIAAPIGSDDHAALMAEKLSLAKGMLEKLAKGELAGVGTDAAALAALTRDARWKVRETPEYMSRSVEFERAANGLAAAASGGNADGAALAWVQVNLQCLDCHRWARAGKSPKQ